MRQTLRFTSCQAPSADFWCEDIVALVGTRLGMAAQIVNDVPWKERERRFDAGVIDVCWMCGWPYVVRADVEPADIELLATPIMADPRYEEQPVYFSDIVVRADSTRYSFQDLRGASWAYNEPRSHSGYNVVRYLLAMQNLDGRFFGSVIETGSHSGSVELLLDGVVDGTAIDSTVLEAMCRARAEIAPRLRVIGTIGPSPAPPFVVRASLDRSLREAIRTEFLTIHETPEGRSILESAGIKQFGAVSDGYYDTIREMAAIAATIELKPVFSLFS